VRPTLGRGHSSFRTICPACYLLSATQKKTEKQAMHYKIMGHGNVPLSPEQLQTPSPPHNDTQMLSLDPTLRLQIRWPHDIGYALGGSSGRQSTVVWRVSRVVFWPSRFGQSKTPGRWPHDIGCALGGCSGRRSAVVWGVGRAVFGVAEMLCHMWGVSGYRQWWGGGCLELLRRPSYDIWTFLWPILL